MPRRVSLILFLGFAATLILTTGITAGAQAPGDDIAATEEEIAAAQERLKEIRMGESDALADYDIALSKMNELNGKIADAEKDLQAAEEDLAEAQASLEERASQVYRSGNVGFVDVLVGVDNFSEFASRVDLWVRLLKEERAAYEAVLEAKNDLEERKSALETERVSRVEAVEEALDRKKQVEDTEGETEEYLNSLNADLQSAIEAEQQRQARLARQAAKQAIAEQAAAEQAAAEQAAAEQAAAEQAAAEQAAAEQAAAERAAAQAAAEEAQRQAELAAEQAAAAERRAERQAAQEEAERQAELAAIEKAAAEQAAAEQAAAERAAERQAAREAARAEELAAQRAEERAAERAAERAEEEASTAASAEAGEDEASAPAASYGREGAISSCGQDFGGVHEHVAEAGCDLQERFGLRVTGIGYSDYHWDGMDLDIWTSDVALGNQVRDYTLANYDVEYTCWQDLYVNYATGWEEGCPGHMDHVHITFQ